MTAAKCTGRLAYRVLAGMRVLGTDESGLLVYEWRCDTCGEAGASVSGDQRHHDQVGRGRGPTTAQEVRRECIALLRDAGYTEAALMLKDIDEHGDEAGQ